MKEGCGGGGSEVHSPLSVDISSMQALQMNEWLAFPVRDAVGV